MPTPDMAGLLDMARTDLEVTDPLLSHLHPPQTTPHGKHTLPSQHHPAARHRNTVRPDRPTNAHRHNHFTSSCPLAFTKLFRNGNDVLAELGSQMANANRDNGIIPMFLHDLAKDSHADA